MKNLDLDNNLADNINIDTHDNDVDTITTISTRDIEPDDKEDAKCAPTAKFSSGSCIDLLVLIAMAEAYNETNKEKIKMHPKLETLNPTKYKKYLLKEIGNRYENVCDTQFCWTQQDFIKKMDKLTKDELLKFTWRPEGPEGQFEWLNTTHLNEVMAQYEKAYDGFKFLGAVPMDFDKLPMLELDDQHIRKHVNDKITRFGIIYNLDEHWQKGSHWVASYFDLEKGYIYYFDSYGIAPEKRVRTLLRRFAVISENDFGTKLDARHNKVRQQYGNSECGMFSLNFILKLLEGNNFDDVCNKKISDDDVNRLRPIFFKNVNF